MKLFSNIFLLLAILVFSSCQDVKIPERPENLISENKIVEIYTDAYINNAAKNINNKKLVEYGVKLDSVLYKKYNIDSLQFASSNAYYSSDLSNYTKIFNRVELRLKVLQSKVDSIVLVKEIELEEALCDSMYPKDSLKIEPVKATPEKVDAATLIDPVISD